MTRELTVLQEKESLLNASTTAACSDVPLTEELNISTSTTGPNEGSPSDPRNEPEFAESSDIPLPLDEDYLIRDVTQPLSIQEAAADRATRTPPKRS